MAVKFMHACVCVCVLRLHKEALKQAAVDPSTGKIDVSILTTGISGAVRKQRAERAEMLLELIKAKGKVLVLKYNKLYEEFREKIIEKGEQVCHSVEALRNCLASVCLVKKYSL